MHSAATLSDSESTWLITCISISLSLLPTDQSSINCHKRLAVAWITRNMSSLTASARLKQKEINETTSQLLNCFNFVCCCCLCFSLFELCLLAILHWWWLMFIFVWGDIWCCSIFLSFLFCFLSLLYFWWFLLSAIWHKVCQYVLIAQKYLNNNS